MKNPNGVEFMVDAFGEAHLEYCGFETVEALIADHKGLKKQIKERELLCDDVLDILSYSNVSVERQHEDYSEEISNKITDPIEQIQQECMTINM